MYGSKQLMPSGSPVAMGIPPGSGSGVSAAAAASLSPVEAAQFAQRRMAFDRSVAEIRRSAPAVPQIDTNELLRWLCENHHRVLVVDVRSPEERNFSVIPRAISRVSGVDGRMCRGRTTDRSTDMICRAGGVWWCGDVMNRRHSNRS